MNLILNKDTIITQITKEFNIKYILILDGYPKQKSTIQLEQSKIIHQIHILEQFMIVFYEGSLIQIFNIDDCFLVQSLDIGSKINEGVVKFITHFQNQQVVYFGSQSEIRNLYLVSFEDQITKLLKECNIEKALQIFNQHYSKTNSTRQQRLEDFNIDASWSLLLYGKFNEAYKIIEDNFRYDIRQFIDSFTNEEDINSVIAKIKKNLLTSHVNTNSNSLGRSGQQSMTLKKDKEYRDDILKFLVKLCTKNREHYLKYLNNTLYAFDFYLSNHSHKFYTAMRKRHKFSYNENVSIHQNYLKSLNEKSNSSEKSTVSSNTSSFIRNEDNNLSVASESETEFEENITAKQMLEQLDFYLIQYLVMQNNEADLINVLSNSSNNCLNKYDELLQILQSQMPVGPKHTEVFSRFYEYFQNHTQALLLWQECIKEKKQVSEACDHITRILKNFPKEKLIQNFFPNVMENKPTKAIEVFTVLNPDKFPPAVVKQLIQETPNINSETKNFLIGEYYEVLATQFLYIDTNIHNSLADYYVKYLFSKYSKDKSYFDLRRDLRLSGQKDSVLSQETVNKYYSFDKFLKNPQMLYEAQFVLKSISDSYLQDQIIFLLCKLDQHEKALRILIEQGDHDTAQIECNRDQSKLLPILFKIYLEKYNQSITECSNTFVSSLQRKSAIRPKSQSKAQERNNYNLQRLYKDYLDDILYKYSYYKDLNPIDIINLIPDDWVLASSSLFNPYGEPEDSKDNNKSKDDSFDKSLDEENTALFQFLTQALSETLYTQRQMKCTKYASESQLLHTKIKVIKCKKAYISQFNDRKCAACNKLITDTTIFVIYPNGVLAHQSCVSKSSSICPETGQDFIKSFIS